MHCFFTNPLLFSDSLLENYGTTMAGYISVNAGNFGTWWDAGDVVHIEVEQTSTGDVGTGEFTLDNESYQMFSGLDGIIIAPLLPPSEVWIDADYTEGSCGGHNWNYDAFDTIQEGIDGIADAGTINVAAGTYDEAILIDGKDLTIQAASTPVLTGIADSDYIVKVSNADVTLDGLTVNGAGNNIKNGIWYYNATTGGEVKNCTVQGIERANAGTAVRIENSAVNITGNLLKEFWRNGIFVRDAGSGGTTISGNEIICHSIDDVDGAYHGIEIGYGAKNITVQDNTIYDHVISTLPELMDWNWSSQGIVVWGSAGSTIMTSTADILNNTVHHVMEGIHIGYQQLDGDTSYALIRGNHVYDCFYNIGVVSDADADIDNNTIEMLDQDVIDFVADWGEGIWVGGAWSGSFVEDSTANITNNTIDNCYLGIDLYENAAITVTGNTITNCDYGIKTNADAGEGWAQTVVAHFNNIVGNSEYGVDNSANTVASFDAQNNWWGDDSGPGPAGPGSGDAVSDNVDYDPWIGVAVEQGQTEDLSDTGGTIPADESPTGGEVTVSGISIPADAALTVAKYADNPGGATTFTASDDYWDVHLSNDTGVDSVTIDFCPADSEEIIYYWDGSDWIACSNQAYAGGCITVTIQTGDTAPSLADLAGLPFASSGTSVSVGADDDSSSCFIDTVGR